MSAIAMPSMPPAAGEPLRPAARRALAVLMVAAHAAVIAALARIDPSQRVVERTAAIAVDLIVAPPAQQQPRAPTPAQPTPAQPTPPDPRPPRTRAQAPTPAKPAAPSPVFATHPTIPPTEPSFVAPPPSPTQVPTSLPAPAQPPQSAAPRAQAPAERAPAPPAPVAPAQPAQPVTIAITAVEYLSPPTLVYPPGARRAQEEGRVHVSLLVDERGRPRDARVTRSSGYERLDEAALAAARATLFKPYTENGVARAFRVVMPLIFELEN